MDFKAPTASLCLHEETRVSFDTTEPNSILHIQLASTSAFSRSSRAQRKLLNRLPACKTDDEFRRRHLATSSSIYFRPSHRYPRCLAWRCVERQSVLELRAVDLSRTDSTAVSEANLLLRFAFPSAIRPGCIALADAADTDGVCVFVVTRANDLYTLSLGPDHFSRRSGPDDDSTRWCRVYRPACFSVGTPHCLRASSAQELLCGLGDGSLVRLTRRLNDSDSSGARWEERAFTNGQWTSSLRGLIRWQGSSARRYDGSLLEETTPLAAATSPDAKHHFAVCLNHTLRAWNAVTGLPTLCRDLVNRQRDAQEMPKLRLDPASSSLLVIFEGQAVSDGDQYYVLTFSPHDSGLFKVWAIRDADREATGIRDLFPDDLLKLPDPDDGAHWTMADFRLKTAPGTEELELWILMRLNRRYKLYNRKFPKLRSLGDDWQKDWSVTAIALSRKEPSNEPPLKVSDTDSDDVSERWLHFLQTPGRIPESLLETALVVYSQTREIPRSSHSVTLKQRLSSTIGSQVHLQHQESGPDFSKFRNAISEEWNGFWTIVTELDHSRWEPLSLSLDNYTDMPWILMTDGCSSIRSSTETEMFVHNKPADLVHSHMRSLMQSVEIDADTSAPRTSDELAVLVEVAAKFRSTFSDALHQSCADALERELWQDSSHSAPIRMQSLYDRAGFSLEVGDRQYNDLATSLKEIGGFEGLTTSLFYGVLESLPVEIPKTASALISTSFGVKILMKGAQDTIALQNRVLTDLIYFITFVDMDVDRDDCPMDELDSPRVYVRLLESLKATRLLLWLASTPCTGQSSTEQTDEANLSDTATLIGVSALEKYFATDIRPQSFEDKSQSTALSLTIRDLLCWVQGGNFKMSLDQVLVGVASIFLKDLDVRLATAFLKFLPSTTAAYYIRARLCILRFEFTEAAVYLRKAAFSLSRANNTSDIKSLTSLLDPSTYPFFGAGLYKFYAHAIALFSSLHAHSQVAEFAGLALQFCSPNSSEYAGLLEHMFDASLITLSFDAAYAALQRLSDEEQQKKALIRLVDEMTGKGYVQELVALPFPTLKDELEALLQQRAQAEFDGSTASTAVPYVKILYAWRLRRGDFRGAASILIEHLYARQKHARKGRLGGKGSAAENDRLLDDYLVGINALVLAGVGTTTEPWVFVHDRHTQKRNVVRLQDVRQAYQLEMDRRGAIEMGRFGIVGNEEDEDDDEDTDMLG